MKACDQEVIVFCRRCLELGGGQNSAVQLCSEPVVFTGSYQTGAAHICCAYNNQIEVKFKGLRVLRMFVQVRELMRPVDV